MKTSLCFACCLSVAMLVFAPWAAAQQSPYFGGAYGYGGGGQVYEPAAGASPGIADVQVGFPGRVWFGTNVADQGLGYTGSYATVGAKTRLWEDRFDGRWLFEGRLHHSLEGGGLFANMGIERVFSIDAAGADVSVGAWFDYDDDKQSSFAHTFYQAGVSASIKTRRWDLVGNGYFPQGERNFALGDPTGQNCFFGNRIIIEAGIDTALKGFDVTLRQRPAALKFINGSIDIGGYGYNSDLVDFFGGGRARLNAQLLGGLLVSSEVAYDERFDVTGSVSVTYIFGVNARGSEYSGIGRDLERTLRNDHIVRYNRDVLYAIDPDTGLPYTVWHVDNSADAGVADGTAETPFTRLADAEAASGTDDIIFVREGFGTVAGYDTGIQLQDRQMLLGDGVEHIIPLAGGTNFRLCNDIDGNRPTITGRNNGAAVNLANGNVVRGFVIDGSVAPGGMSYGIYGDGFGAGAPINGATIEDNDISGAVLHGVYIDESRGDFVYSRNNITDNGFDGILMEDHVDSTSTLTFDENTVDSNGRDGIHLNRYDADMIDFLSNITSNNARDGTHLEDFLNGAGTGTDIDFRSHTALGNGVNGINVVRGDGNLRFLNSNIQTNGGAGIRIEDWTTSIAGDQVLIGTTTGGTSLITGNGVGIDVILNTGVSRVLITDSRIDANNIGIRAATDGLGTSLSTSVLDNLSVSSNLSDGMRFLATGGSTHTVLVDQTTTSGFSPLTMSGNGTIAGNGIQFFSGDKSGGNISLIDAIVRNVSITGSGGNGIAANVIQDGALNLLVETSTVSNNTLDGIDLIMNTNFNKVVNQITIRNSTFTNNGVSGLDMSAFGGTFTDLVLTSNTFNGGAGDGIEISINGNLANPDFDNRTRLWFQGNVITGYLLNGIDLVANGDARMLARIENNLVSNNGFATGALPFFHGINANTNDSAELDMRLTNNIITGNAERGLNLLTQDTGVINTIMLDNALGGNDLGDDPVAVNDTLIDDMTVINGVTGRICLSMSNNSFSLLPPQFVNLGAPGFFVLELDGLTNGFGAGAVGTPATFPLFGTVCEPLVAAEETAFLADGFPPQ